MRSDHDKLDVEVSSLLHKSLPSQCIPRMRAVERAVVRSAHADQAYFTQPISGYKTPSSHCQRALLNVFEGLRSAE